MPQKRHTVDQIVAKLRKADVELGKGNWQRQLAKAKGARNLQVARSHRTDVLPLATRLQPSLHP